MARDEIDIEPTPRGGYHVTHRRRHPGFGPFIIILIGLYTVGSTNNTWLFIPFVVMAILTYLAGSRQ